MSVSRIYSAAGFFASVFCIYCLNNTQVVAMPDYVRALGGDEFLCNAQTSLFVLLAVLLRKVTGRLAGTYGAKFMLCAGAFGFLLPCVLLPLCVDLWQVIFVRALQAFGLAAYHPCVSQFASELAGPARVGRFVGAARFVGTLSLMVGPLLLLPLINRFGYVAFFGSLALLGCAGLAFIALVRNAKGAEGLGENGVIGESEGLSSDRDPSAWFLVAPFAVSLAYSLLLNTGSRVFEEAALSVSGGAMFTCASAGGLVGSLAFGCTFDKWGVRVSLVAALAVLSTGLLGVSSGLVIDLPSAALIILLGFASFCIGFGYFGAIALCASAAGSLGAGGVFFSRQQNALDLGMVFGGVFVGALLQAEGGLSLPYAICGILIAGFALGYALLPRGKASHGRCMRIG